MMALTRESAGNPQLAECERRSCVEQSSSLVAVEVVGPRRTNLVHVATTDKDARGTQG
ncbi:MAG TPA: hypothetical protein VHM93_09600 [Candidatus Acidoferrum sp.]|jgi:hypothetical protein|nr:hypothetical protein [Candidatus Acidoferrum sp.]